ncbi:hypothetical protein GCM10023322_57770 [Rugosimonospora acidiphila]|uniref:IPT/TIG domain-containing protein n=1 Tax=Rugosimonospora acidiphila TaxID=556531 RepID=A0ABP9SD57_9ACTN
MLALALAGLASLGAAPANAAPDDPTVPAGPVPTQSVEPAPIVGINSIDPQSGSTQGGFTITVTGVGFAPGQTGVRICDIDLPPASVQVDSTGDTLTFTAPACAAGQTQLLVSTPTGEASTVFDYEAEGALPVTGSSIELPITAGAALVVAGGLALLLTRRRSPRPLQR